MLPIKAGIVDSLPGINVSYKRSVLNKMGDAFRNGFYETFFNNEVIKRGHHLYLTPSAIVYHKKNYRFWETLIQFYQHGYTYAGKRISKMSSSMRLLSIFGSIALPILLLSRIVLRTFRKRKNIKKMIFSLPYIVFFVSSWSFGEFRGYLFGKLSTK